MESVNIYILIDPRDNEIRYVGKTIQTLSRRLISHRHDGTKQSSHRSRWIAKLTRCGYNPLIELVQIVPSEQWENAEKYWIKYYRSIGCDLTNTTDGGDCGPVMIGKDNPFYGQTHTEATRAKISRSRLGKPLSREHKEALIAGQRASTKVNTGRFQPGMTVDEAGRERRSRTAQQVNCKRWSIDRGKQCVCGEHTDYDIVRSS